jgi:hypothetical protein
MPHRKHIASALQRPTSKCCLGKLTLFIVTIVRNTRAHSVGKMQNFLTWVNLYRLHGVTSEKAVLFIVTTVRTSDLRHKLFRAYVKNAFSVHGHFKIFNQGVDMTGETQSHV